MESRAGESQTNDISTTNGNRNPKQRNNSVRELLPSDTPTNARGKNTLVGNEAEQLKLDFSQTVETKQSTNDIVSGIVNGDVLPTTKTDIETIVSKVAFGKQ